MALIDWSWPFLIKTLTSPLIAIRLIWWSSIAPISDVSMRKIHKCCGCGRVCLTIPTPLALRNEDSVKWAALILLIKVPKKVSSSVDTSECVCVSYLEVSQNMIGQYTVQCCSSLHQKWNDGSNVCLFESPCAPLYLFMKESITLWTLLYTPSSKKGVRC